VWASVFAEKRSFRIGVFCDFLEWCYCWRLSYSTSLRTTNSHLKFWANSSKSGVGIFGINIGGSCIPLLLKTYRIPGERPTPVNPVATSMAAKPLQLKCLNAFKINVTNIESPHSRSHRPR